VNRRSLLSALPALPLVPLAGRAAEAVTVGAVDVQAAGYAASWAKLSGIYKGSVPQQPLVWTDLFGPRGYDPDAVATFVRQEERRVADLGLRSDPASSMADLEWLPWGSPLPVVDGGET
jgi:hypothetical protein